MNVDQLAAEQLKDFDRQRPGSSFANPEVFLSVEQSYALQFQVAGLREQRGEQVAGYKIGCISRTMQNQLGLDSPVFGHVWQSELHASGGTLHATRFDGLAIEGEFAVRLADDVPSAQWLRRNAEVLAAGFVVIELHNYVFRGLPDRRAAELIANNAIHAGVVLPVEETPLENAEALSSATVRVLRNGELLGEAAGSELEGGPLASVVSLAEHLEKYGRRLRRGQVVLTGSPLPLWRVAVGDVIEVQCDPFGKTARVRVDD
ncbi:2-keto-4-pentenoate hydratase [Planctomycetes bacterium TBK1r]|uniref:2-keto-4-pentenoate hydratase n=1 Tax=Stieleria magnilauensis TaxID=2527963 RepID=A0ABX5XIV0_9BACT|nr:2-keto-4-pentenoate hydratase [Planctomycetes bacterium TBK1r]